MSRPRDIISAELGNAEKQLGACIEIVTLNPAREAIAEKEAVQRIYWAAEVKRLADEFAEAEFTEGEIV